MKPSLILGAVCLFVLAGCDDDSDDSGSLDATSSTATYEVTIQGMWNENYAPLPASPGFSPAAGAVVNDQISLWEPGELATPGFEELAEEGTTASFIQEITTAINRNEALSRFTTSYFTGTNSVTFEVNVNRAFPEITFASMLDPSPDWIIGVECFSFLDEEGLWVTSMDRDLPVYDAGTEEGNGFSLDNPQTEPPEPIALLNGTVGDGIVFVNGLVGGNPIATLSVRRTR